MIFIHILRKKKKKNKLLFRAVSVKSLVQIEKCVFHHNDFVYLEMLKLLMIFYWFCIYSPALVLEQVKKLCFYVSDLSLSIVNFSV